MSIEDLEQHGVLLPKEEWGTHQLETTTSQVSLLFMFSLSVLGCVLTWYGNGNAWTWLGIGLFLVTFFLVILMCDRAIRRQRRRTKEERDQSKKTKAGRDDD